MPAYSAVHVVSLILAGSANDVGVFPSVDARESLPHHASEKSAVATPKVNSVKPFALGQS
jgi:hypothetical protein